MEPLSGSQYQIIVESSPNMIWRAGTNAECNYFNATWLAFTGRTLEQEQGNGWAKGVHPDDFDRCLHIYLEAFGRRESFEMEYRLLRYDGQYRWINDRGVPVFAADDEFLGYIGSCMDVTEKVEGQQLRRLTDQLAESENRYRALLEQSTDAVILYDPATHCYVEANHRFYSLTGYHENDLVDLRPPILLEGSAEWVDAYFASMERDEVLKPRMCRMRRQDGSPIVTEGSGSVIKYRGKSLYMSIFRDITTQRKLEEELRNEVEYAAAIQRELLPVDGMGSYDRIKTIYAPFHIASGDFFHYSRSKDGKKLKGYVMDCVGHGSGAALQTAALNVLMQKYMETDWRPREILDRLNQDATKYLAPAAFAAIFYFELDYERRLLTGVTGGINCFLAVTKELQGMVKTPGSLVGVDPDSEFPEFQAEIQIGDVFYFLTDGLSELLPPDIAIDKWKDFDGAMEILQQLAASPDRWDDAALVGIMVTDFPAKL